MQSKCTVYAINEKNRVDSQIKESHDLYEIPNSKVSYRFLGHTIRTKIRTWFLSRQKQQQFHACTRACARAQRCGSVHKQKCFRTCMHAHTKMQWWTQELLVEGSGHTILQVMTLRQEYSLALFLVGKTYHFKGSALRKREGQALSLLDFLVQKTSDVFRIPNIDKKRSPFFYLSSPRTKDLNNLLKSSIRIRII